jgi:3-vinyl bacteriochlorophyllide hydratase
MEANPWNFGSFDPGVTLGRIDGFSAGNRQRKGIIDLFVDRTLDRFAACPWTSTAGSPVLGHESKTVRRMPLYSAEERRRRDSTIWTTVQGVLAPLQFAIFAISLGLVLRYLIAGEGYELAAASVAVKTLVLYAIMVTGSIWEKQVFGKYLFARAFFWEDAVSMLVLALHTAYLAALLSGWGNGSDLMMLALAAYATYAVNATQFVLKLRAARLDTPRLMKTSLSRDAA